MGSKPCRSHHGLWRCWTLNPARMSTSWNPNSSTSHGHDGCLQSACLSFLPFTESSQIHLSEFVLIYVGVWLSNTLMFWLHGLPRHECKLLLKHLGVSQSVIFDIFWPIVYHIPSCWYAGTFIASLVHSLAFWSLSAASVSPVESEKPCQHSPVVCGWFISTTKTSQWTCYLRGTYWNFYTINHPYMSCNHFGHIWFGVVCVSWPSSLRRLTGSE